MSTAMDGLRWSNNMSLFGGDSGPPSPSQNSDFSISTIGDDDGNKPADAEERQDKHDDGQEADEQDHVASRSPSAASDTSDAVTRPNRFRGSDRAWLHHTHSERSLAASLDQLAATDLSLHLYSAHHLKARLRNSPPGPPPKPWSRKGRWLSTNDDGQKPWHPDSDWTAWPLDPHLAPTGHETAGQLRDGLDAFTLRNKAHHSPPDSLQDQLCAVMLAQASHSWSTSNQPTGPLRASYRPTKAPRDSTPKGDKRRQRSWSASIAPSLPPSSSVADDLPPLSSMDQSTLSVHPAGDPMGTRNSMPDAVVKSEDVNPDRGDESAHPVFSADDDNSDKILHPTVRHIMSKLDNLLLALHQSRRAHSYRARGAADTSDSSATSASRSRSKSSKPSPRASTPAPSRKSRRSTRSASRRSTPPPDYVMFDDSGEDETYYPSSKQQKHDNNPTTGESSSESEVEAEITSPNKTKRRIKVRKPGVRDWSEILGVAAMNGWNPTAIQRTQQRCRDLFDEDMTLHAMHEYADSSADEAYPVGIPQQIQPGQTGWRCPFVSCFRHISPFDQGFRWREHMRKSHKYDNEQIANLEEQLVKSGDITLGTKRRKALVHNPRAWQPPDPLKCPHCTSTEIVYPKVGRLLEHLRRTHKYDPRIDAPPDRRTHTGADQDESNTSDETSSSDQDSDDFMVGGVHNDGFLQPVLRHAGVRSKDLTQRAKRSNIRRSKAELENAKKRKLSVDQEPAPSVHGDDMTMT